MSERTKPKPIFIISDGTGQTAESVMRACRLQFEGVPLTLQTFPNVTDAEQLARLMRLAADQHALVVTTLVRAEQRAEAERLAQHHRLKLVDIIGGPLKALSSFLRVHPKGNPGLMYKADEDYFRRVEAVEFSVKADDGKEPRMLSNADIVLVGVSRTGKTPLSVFLAHKGYKVGNVPLVLDREPPDDLWDVDPRRIFALTIDPEALQTIRRERLETMRLHDRLNYSQMDYILAELDYAHALFSRNREWPVIDVTRKAVEETAAVILKVMLERGLTLDTSEAGQL
jgi:regulator of PEP synthase PpsR (kinase-PPPase family)